MNSVIYNVVFGRIWLGGVWNNCEEFVYEIEICLCFFYYEFYGVYLELGISIFMCISGEFIINFLILIKIFCFCKYINLFVIGKRVIDLLLLIIICKWYFK